MKSYQTFEEIDKDLKIYSLKKKIALEELKLVQGKVEADLQPMHFTFSLLKMLGRFGVYKMIRKIFKSKER